MKTVLRWLTPAHAIPTIFVTLLIVGATVGSLQNYEDTGSIFGNNCTANNTCQMPDPRTASIGYSDTTPVCNIAAQTLLSDINSARSTLGEQPLTVDQRLQSTSSEKLNDMVAGKYYGHNGLNGQLLFPQLMANQGLNSVAAGEDLDANTDNAAETWQNFSDSPDHYKSLTSDSYKLVGITTECNLNYTVVKDTSPQTESEVVNNNTGSHIHSLVVVHLAE